MMQLTDIISKYGVKATEKALVYNYLTHNSINADDNTYIKSYLGDYEVDESLMYDIKALNHASLAELAVDMELLIPESDRITNGAFFTPQYIVDYIINEIHPKADAKVIDISCGSGAFLLGIIRYYKTEYNKKISSIVADNLYGIDLLDYNVRRSKLLIILYGMSEGETIDERNIKVDVDNSLTKKWSMRFDAVIGNPPYVKFQDMEDSTRSMLQERYITTTIGTYNLYFAFFEKGREILQDTGLLGYITPNNYFTSLSGINLRRYFMDNKSVRKVVDFGATKVFDVQTYTAITFLSKQSNDAIEYTRIQPHMSPSQFLSSCTFTDNSYDEIDVKKWRLLCNNERAIINRIETSGTPIGKLFDIAVGIATLKDEAYFIDITDEDDSCYICNNKYSKSFRIEKGITKPLVKISNIKNPDMLAHNSKRIIFPYTVRNGIANVILEDVMRTVYPNCYDYLLQVKEVLGTRGKGKCNYSPFYLYGRSQGLNKSAAKIYTPTFSQYPRFIFDSMEDSLFTNGYALFFKDKEPADLFSNSNNAISKDNVDVILKILNSGLMHFYVKKTSVSIEGGYPCYQKNFIEKFSIPALSQSDIDAIRSADDRENIDTLLINLYQIKRPVPNLWE